MITAAVARTRTLFERRLWHQVVAAHQGPQAHRVCCTSPPITLFFFIGGVFATLIRVELLTPQGDLVSSETYNKLFTMHGVMMIFFFLIPSIPATLGNFFLPMMIGARDLAFPRINLLSWYLLVIGGLFALFAMLAGGVDTGWTFYTPYSTTYSNRG